MSAPASWMLDSVLSPSSVAVIGASENQDGHTGRVVANLKRTGYRGALYPVNPGRKEIAGLRCYPSISAIHQVPECAYVLVRADRVPGVVRECVAAGVSSVVICSAGFAEEGDHGRRLEEQVRREISSGPTRVLGPNCIGVINPVDRVIPAPTFNLTYDYTPGGVALVSQSGGVGVNVFNRAQGNGIGIRALFSVGNELDLDTAQLLDALVDDPRTTVVGLVIEQLRDIGRFGGAVARANAAGKPVLVLKLGTSEAGARSSQGHTGAMAGSAQVFSDVMRQLGVLEATTIDELLGAAHLLDRKAAPQGDRILVISPSGGDCTYVADRAADRGLRLPELDPSTRERLGRIMRFGHPTNPLDLTGQVIGDPQLLDQALATVRDDPHFDAAILGVPTWGRHDADRLLPSLVAAARSSDRPMVLSAWSARRLTERAEEILLASGLPWFSSADDAAAALALSSQAATARGAEGPPQRGTADEVPRPSFFSSTPTEAEVMSMLRDHCLPVADEVVVETLAEAERVADDLGWPVVMKQLADGVLHKSDLGLVAPAVTDRADVQAAWSKFDAAVAQHRLHPAGVLVARSYTGVETIVGGVRDPSYGPLVMVGAGGVWAERLSDTIFALCPLSISGARDVIRGLRLGRILAGYRGSVYDIDSLAKLVVQVSRLMVDAPWIRELDLNPVFVHEGSAGVTVADAALVTT